jgi:hypothetical protein
MILSLASGRLLTGSPFSFYLGFACLPDIKKLVALHLYRTIAWPHPGSIFMHSYAQLQNVPPD